jgi:hypothetical protein
MDKMNVARGFFRCVAPSYSFVCFRRKESDARPRVARVTEIKRRAAFFFLERWPVFSLDPSLADFRWILISSPPGGTRV